MGSNEICNTCATSNVWSVWRLVYYYSGILNSACILIVRVATVFKVDLMVASLYAHAVVLFILKPSSTSMSWNYMIHWGLHFGVSVMVFCYAMEFYARLICPKEENFMNTFFPRFYECFVKH